MSNKPTPFEIMKLLDNSNCRQCGEKTCMAFAAAVFKGQRRLEECPKLNPETIARISPQEQNDLQTEEDAQEDILQDLKKQVSAIDLEQAAVRTGGRIANKRLTLKILGKDFSVDKQGNLYSEIHTNPWVAAPFLDYVLNGKGTPPSGSWVSFRELKDGRERYPLYQKRCEEQIKKVADNYPGLFQDMIQMFSAREVEAQFTADIAVVLHPLPKVPIMICYWFADEGMDSSLHIFWDETARENLSIGSIFSLGAGLAQMFFRLAQRHGYNIEQPGQ